MRQPVHSLISRAFLIAGTGKLDLMTISRKSSASACISPGACETCQAAPTSVALAAHRPDAAFQLQDFLGTLLLMAAILGEAIADRQLMAFRQNKAEGEIVCDRGLWHWSRHPNYFFEWLGWVAFAVIGADFTGSYWWGWLAVSAPAVMYWALVHVSGIPPLEQHMLRTRGDAYRAYQERTSSFFLWPARRRVIARR